MKLIINGQENSYPTKITDLEGLLFYVNEAEALTNDILVEVKVDGALYSEEYAHQARKVSLDSLERVEIFSRSKEDFCKDSMAQVPSFIEHLSVGFGMTSRLLRDPRSEAEGYDMLARSADALYALKVHLERSKEILPESKEMNDLLQSWDGKGDMINHIIDAQKDTDSVLIADILDDQMLPFLDQIGRKLS
jgi:hypothetical protein